MKSKYKLFHSAVDYGQYEQTYCFDTVLGRPYVKEEEYEMRFYGPGDHIGVPGAKICSDTKVITFGELRSAAKRCSMTRFYEIDENNWQGILAGLW